MTSTGQHHGHSAGQQHSGRLFAVLCLTATFMIIEATAGILANSLVLLADAGHMLTDVTGISIALFAMWFARRPANASKTYGYYRLEILAALANALLLFGVSTYILFEAYQRFRSPPEVQSLPLLLVASAGLAVNIAAAAVLMAPSRLSINLRGAFLEVLSDILGSLGALTAGIILLVTGWRYADPVFATAIGLFILPRTWVLLKAAVDVLLEGTPGHISIGRLQAELLALPGITGLHDVHVWMITSGFVAMSGHAVVTIEADRDTVLLDATAMLHDKFDIEHVTLQLEPAALAGVLQQPCLPGMTACYVDPDELVGQRTRAKAQV